MTDTVAILLTAACSGLFWPSTQPMFLVEIGARLKMLVLHDDAVREYARGCL